MSYGNGVWLCDGCVRCVIVMRDTTVSVSVSIMDGVPLYLILL